MPKGSAVPLPSERLVPSIRQVPGYNSAVSNRGMPTLGITQQCPQSRKVICRVRPPQGTTCKSQPQFNSSFIITASSPQVRP